MPVYEIGERTIELSYRELDAIAFEEGWHVDEDGCDHTWCVNPDQYEDDLLADGWQPPGTLMEFRQEHEDILQELHSQAHPDSTIYWQSCRMEPCKRLGGML